MAGLFWCGFAVVLDSPKQQKLNKAWICHPYGFGGRFYRCFCVAKQCERKCARRFAEGDLHFVAAQRAWSIGNISQLVDNHWERVLVAQPKRWFSIWQQVRRSTTKTEPNFGLLGFESKPHMQKRLLIWLDQFKITHLLFTS